MKRKSILAFAILVTAAFLLTVLAVPIESQAAVLAANKTEILFDGQKIHGLKGFTYNVYKDRQDVRGIGMNEIAEEIAGIGMNERLGVVYGRLHVKGKILVHSNSEMLNNHMENNLNFQIVFSIMQDSYPEGLGLKQFTFDGCHVEERELQIGEGGNTIAIYTFSAKNYVLYERNLLWQEKIDIMFTAPSGQRGRAPFGESSICAFNFRDSEGSQLVTAKYADADAGSYGVVGWWREMNADTSLMSVGPSAPPTEAIKAEDTDSGGIADVLSYYATTGESIRFLLSFLSDNPLTDLLNKHMDNNTSFQIVLSIMQDSYPEGLGLKQFTFDGVHCDDREFQLDSHGYALTTYTFTGDRIREA